MTQEQINELRNLAQAATPGPWYAEGGTTNKDVIYVYSEHSDFEVCHGDTSDSDYIAAANPAAILALIQQRDELLRIAGDAATSLETIHIRSFGDDSYLNHPDQMRAYAGSRAGVVRKELKGAGIDQ